jgi:hypothetical protein
VAAALGKLDAFNLFDPFWSDPEYDLWYALLDCGFRLPASTGTDWFVCSNNRVYVWIDEAFSYQAWIDGMKAGRTFITNGPILDLSVDGQGLGGTVERSGGGTVEAEVSFTSHYPIERVELVADGEVVHRWEWPGGRRQGRERRAVTCSRDGWLAARLWGNTRDSFGHSLWAHSSPVWIRCGALPLARPNAARRFLRSIDESIDWVARRGRFSNDRQRQEVTELFRRGREVFVGLERI